MQLDNIDIKILKENFDEETINQMDSENVYKIVKYLNDNNIDYIKDLFLLSFDLFLLPVEQFIKQFEKLKFKLGDNFANMLGSDLSLIEIMYED